MAYNKPIFAIIMSLLLLACAKSNEPNEPEANPENNMEGSWVYTENYISPGTIWHWEKVADGGIVRINKDSSYEVTKKGALNQWPFAILKDSGKIGTAFNRSFNSKMSYILPANTKDATFVWPIRVSKDTLEIALPCIEGCIFRFRKK